MFNDNECNNISKLNKNKDKNVLELGAGAGLTGLVASQFSASVCLTDNNEIVLDLLEINKSYSLIANVTVAKLGWGTESTESFYACDSKN